MSANPLYGNSLLTMEHDGNGQPIALNPLPWWNAQPIIVPSSPEEAMGPLAPSGRLAFDTLRTVAPWGGTGVRKRYFAEEYSFCATAPTRASSVRRVSRVRLTLVQQGLSVQAFATYLWENVGTPSLALMHPGQLSLEAQTRLQNSWEQTHVGALNARKMIVLEEGMKPEALSIPAEDLEVLESRKFVAQEIARIFGVPPPLVGIWQNANFASAAQAASSFATGTLASWCVAIEREFARVVFNDPDRFHLELDLSALVKGDYATRAQVGNDLVRSGILTANELRQELGWDCHPEGDKLVAQATGGRPPGTGDGEGDTLPQPGARPNGSGLATTPAAGTA